MKLLKVNDKYVRTDKGLILAPPSELDGIPISAISEEEFLALTVESNINKIVSYKGNRYRIAKVNGNVEAVMLSDAPTLIEKTITENGTYSPTDDGVDGYNLVNVNIASSGASENKLALLVGTQDANNPYEITASDLGNMVEVAESFFRDKNGLKSVSLPTTCTKIGADGFRFCKTLTTADLPNVESIAEYGFQNNLKLTSVNMPNVKTIGTYAFDGCDKLTLLTIPATCTNISGYALRCATSSNQCIFRFEGDTPPTIASTTFRKTNVRSIQVKPNNGETYKTATNFTTLADLIVEEDF